MANEPARRRLIVNADDFGRSASFNAAVIRAHREGILTSASLMVNEPGFAEAADLARAHHRLGVGLHLTLVDGHSTLDRDRIPGLINHRREFTADPAAAGLRYFFTPGILDQLHAEIAAQFAAFRATGLALDHVNSHHHLHMHPTIMKLLLRHAREFGITRLRLTWEPRGPHRQTGRPYSLARVVHASAHALLALWAEPRIRRLKLGHPRWVFGLLESGAMDETYLARLLPALPPGDSELYSHPSLDHFKSEFDALVSPRIKGLIDSLGIRLIRYQEL